MGDVHRVQELLSSQARELAAVRERPWHETFPPAGQPPDGRQHAAELRRLEAQHAAEQTALEAQVLKLAERVRAAEALAIEARKDQDQSLHERHDSCVARERDLGRQVAALSTELQRRAETLAEHASTSVSLRSELQSLRAQHEVEMARASVTAEDALAREKRASGELEDQRGELERLRGEAVALRQACDDAEHSQRQAMIAADAAHALRAEVRDLSARLHAATERAAEMEGELHGARQAEAAAHERALAVEQRCRDVDAERQAQLEVLQRRLDQAQRSVSVDFERQRAVVDGAEALRAQTVSLAAQLQESESRREAEATRHRRAAERQQRAYDQLKARHLRQLDWAKSMQDSLFGARAVAPESAYFPARHDESRASHFPSRHDESHTSHATERELLDAISRVVADDASRFDSSLSRVHPDGPLPRVPGGGDDDDDEIDFAYSGLVQSGYGASLANADAVRLAVDRALQEPPPAPPASPPPPRQSPPQPRLSPEPQPRRSPAPRQSPPQPLFSPEPQPRQSPEPRRAFVPSPERRHTKEEEEGGGRGGGGGGGKDRVNVFLPPHLVPSTELAQRHRRVPTPQVERKRRAVMSPDDSDDYREHARVKQLLSASVSSSSGSGGAAGKEARRRPSSATAPTQASVRRSRSQPRRAQSREKPRAKRGGGSKTWK